MANQLFFTSAVGREWTYPTRDLPLTPWYHWRDKSYSSSSMWAPQEMSGFKEKYRKGGVTLLHPPCAKVTPAVASFEFFSLRARLHISRATSKYPTAEIACLHPRDAGKLTELLQKRRSADSVFLKRLIYACPPASNQAPKPSTMASL